MLGRLVTMKLKVNSAEQLTRIHKDKIIPLLRNQKGFRDQSLFIAPGGSEAIAKSFWETKEDAQTYHRTGYREVMKSLSCVLVGTPIVETFEFEESASQKAAAKAA